MHTDIGELADHLLSIEWGSRFESFATKETAFLARYNDFGWLLGNRSFFREPSRLSVTPARRSPMPARSRWSWPR